MKQGMAGVSAAVLRQGDPLASDLQNRGLTGLDEHGARLRERHGDPLTAHALGRAAVVHAVRAPAVHGARVGNTRRRRAARGHVDVTDVNAHDRAGGDRGKLRAVVASRHDGDVLAIGRHGQVDRKGHVGKRGPIGDGTVELDATDGAVNDPIAPA